jgi:hypothetical protein
MVFIPEGECTVSARLRQHPTMACVAGATGIVRLPIPRAAVARQW